MADIIDNSATYVGAPDGPYLDGAAVTPNDSADLPTVALKIYVGGAGTLRITTYRGTVLNFAAVPAGTTVPIRARRVHSTGTSATSIVALHN